MTLALAGLMTLALAGPAAADPPPGVGAGASGAPVAGPQRAWPEALKDRMSRYARLERVADPTGDEREDFRHAMASQRIDDPQGDRIELVRARLARRGHLASQDAYLGRRLGLETDIIEERLAGLTLVRAKADFRRHMLIRADELAELKQYNRDKLELGDPLEKGIRIANDDYDRVRYERQRETKQRRKEVQGEQEEDGGRRADPDAVMGRRDGADFTDDLRDAERLEAIQERADDKDADKRDKDAEKKADRDADKDADKQADKADNAAERSEENAEERSVDRRDDKVILQAEESPRDGS